MKKKISAIIPVYNEEKYIEKCLFGIDSFILPENIDFEVIIVDGVSTDKTIDIIKNLKFKNIKPIVITNPKKFQSFAMNLGINYTDAEWIMRLDAHTFYPRDYLKKLFKTSQEKKAENVGGVLVTKIYDNTYEASLVQSLTTHPFGVGDSGFRTGMKSGYVDTVPFGFFKSQTFKKIGLFNEKLIRAQDYEFNARIRKNGGKIWLNPNIVATYYNQNKLYNFYKKQLLIEAPYNAYMWYVAPYTFTLRHSITGIFSIGFLGGIILAPFSIYISTPFVFIMFLYFSLALFSSIQLAKKYKKFLHIALLPFCFFLFHFLHGLGVLGGALSLILKISPVQKRNTQK